MRTALSLAVVALTLQAPPVIAAVSVQEAMLLAKPAVALVTAEVRAEVTLNCGRGTVTVRPTPFVEIGTGWFVDGKGYLITNAHVVDPAHRMPPWVTHELKKNAIEQACVDRALRAQGLVRGQNPMLEESIRRDATARGIATAQVTPTAQLTILLSSGASLEAEVVKFSPPLGFDINGKLAADSGRDLALLRVKEGDYPAIRLSDGNARIGDPIHIIGFPGVVLSHELLSKSLDATVTNGAISGFKQDAILQDFIQTDAAAAHGNSGGPAVADDARLVGVLTATTLSGSSGAIVQGFNFVIPARDVRKFLEGTPVRPGESRFNAVWQAGLDALFSDHYSAAVVRLREANAMQPNLTDVKQALAEAERKLKNPPPQPFPWAWVTLGVTLLSAGIYGGMFGRRWSKNRYRILPAQVISAIESGRNPQLVDARTKTDLETSPLRLPGAVRLDPDAVLAGKPEAEPSVERDQLIVVYDTSPGEATAERVAAALRTRVQKRADPQGRARWMDECAASGGVEVVPAVDRARDLQEPHARRPRAPCVQGGRGHLRGGRGCQGRGLSRPCRHHTHQAHLRRRGESAVHPSRGGAVRRHGALPRGAAFGRRDRCHGRRADRHQQRTSRLADPHRPQLTKEVVRRLSNWVVQTDRERALSKR